MLTGGMQEVSAESVLSGHYEGDWLRVSPTAGPDGCLEPGLALPASSKFNKPHAVQ